MSTDPPVLDKMACDGITIFTGRPLTPDEQAANGRADAQGANAPRYVEGPVALTHGELADASIEDDGVRRALQFNEANICLTVQAGDAFGEVIVLVQHEGKKAEHRLGPAEQERIRNKCMAGQNALLQQVTDWLTAMFGSTARNWKVRIEGAPCPHATVPYEIVEMAEKLAVVPQREVSVALPLPQRQDLPLHRTS